jgi:EAL domain-containing protein (putative c-di-GMP-specific phosphodiesterase class I)
VVAEGVEEMDDLRALDDFPRQWAQGYHLARPMDGDAMLELLDARRLATAAEDGARVVRLPLQSQAS